MPHIRSNARQILQENAAQVGMSDNLKGYARHEAENDPTFYRWLLEDNDIQDYGIGMSHEDEEVVEAFIDHLPTASE